MAATQKTEEKKSNKGKFTFPTHTVNVTELQSNKKSGNSPFLHQPSFSGLSLCSSKKIPPPFPPPPKKKHFEIKSILTFLL